MLFRFLAHLTRFAITWRPSSSSVVRRRRPSSVVHRLVFFEKFTGINFFSHDFCPSLEI
jgi:hypothetical protein